jgi:hypothetical protein
MVIMLKSSSIYFVIWILLLLLVKISCQMNTLQRFDHTATLIDGKLYILGGQSSTAEETAFVGKEFFYLDVSVKFNTHKLLWQDLSNVNTVPTHYSATSVKGGSNNNTLFLYGGTSSNKKTLLVYAFDPQSSSWTLPNVTNNVNKFDLRGVIDNNGIMYLWGGRVLGGDEGDMITLDTINLNWGIGGLDGAPTSRRDYGAVLLPDRKIIYVGRQEILVILMLFTIP